MRSYILIPALCKHETVCADGKDRFFSSFAHPSCEPRRNSGGRLARNSNWNAKRQSVSILVVASRSHHFSIDGRSSIISDKSARQGLVLSRRKQEFRASQLCWKANEESNSGTMFFSSPLALPPLSIAMALHSLPHLKFTLDLYERLLSASTAYTNTGSRTLTCSPLSWTSPFFLFVPMRRAQRGQALMLESV